MEWAVINLAGKDFAPGLSYVAISRVTALDGILFETPFDFERFSITLTIVLRDRKINMIERTKQLI